MSVAPEPYLKACLRVLYLATVEARLIGMAGCTAGVSREESARLDALMDAVHNLPELVMRWETVDEKLLRSMLAAYDDKWSTHTRVNVRLLAVYEGELAGGAG